MKRFSSMATLLIGGALGLVLLQSLNGCTQDSGSPIAQVLNIFDDEPALDSPGEKGDIRRFDKVYAHYANPTDPNYDRQRRQFSDAFMRVDAYYVRPLDPVKMADAAIEGVKKMKGKPGTLAPQKVVEAGLNAMLASLDPHSSYLNPQEYQDMQVITRGEFGGLGITVTMEKGEVKVISPIEDTPAYLAGVKAGDLIVAINGDPVKGKTLMQAVHLMRGKPGSHIRLTIRRKETKPFDVTITRAVISEKSVRWRIEGNIGYIRVISFSEQVKDGIMSAMSDFRTKLGPRLKGVVLDLRNNPGGLLEQSVILADVFLKKGLVVSVRGRDSGDVRNYDSHDGDMTHGVPMVVLINGGSASASEIVAGALQDRHRAVIMGSRSFGKGSVQTITPLPLGGGLRLTTALYYVPSGRTIQALGIEPDIELLPTAEQKKAMADFVAKAKKEDQPVIRREADLPHAISAQNGEIHTVQAKVPEAKCPSAGTDGKDKPLGCALQYLRTGTTTNFVASLIRKGANMAVPTPTPSLAASASAM
ncbi:S41 family peptidase [Varunaivibrio sulfuroxidans]|uniref:Carboxyl-terminal processing protease n=1 Tax=Varunaivibrio sulfuroxidans TaxID=1773489 RepID=A0A4R3J4X6_9PROT|nr:S41 family peptidase [Varunaivibrio sulfuroxidans]TCS60312.1 carboxyl-terminal processing protease [Varunaivibrio sulfuroxidans]WES31001.1 S41 family peptidase [Varunaivibrio sulfuroxidans]